MFSAPLQHSFSRWTTHSFILPNRLKIFVPRRITELLLVLMEMTLALRPPLWARWSWVVPAQREGALVRSGCTTLKGSRHKSEKFGYSEKTVIFFFTFNSYILLWSDQYFCCNCLWKSLTFGNWNLKHVIWYYKLVLQLLQDIQNNFYSQ